MKGEAITAKGLVKQYGERTVVDGLDLEVWPGEIVGLLGPNGAGKTTTFNMIVGAIRPTHGSVFLGEREITSLLGAIPGRLTMPHPSASPQGTAFR